MAIAALVFLAVTLGMIASYQLLTGWMSLKHQRIRRRLSDGFKGQDAPAISLFKDLDQLEPLYAPPQLSDAEMAQMTAKIKPKRNLRKSWLAIKEQANLRVSLVHMIAATVGLQLTLALVGWLWMGIGLGVVGLVLGSIPIPVWIYLRYHSQREKLIQQLPDAFGLMARVLRSGQSVSQALQSVAETSEPPVAEKFASCFHHLNMGLSPEQAFGEMAHRTPVVEMRIFLMALSIQQQSGGKLSDVLDRLAKLIRMRLHVRRQVKTFTAEGRMQGWVLFVLPFLLFGILMFVNRSYAVLLLDQVSLLIAAGISMLLGMLWIRRIINFDF